MLKYLCLVCGSSKCFVAFIEGFMLSLKGCPLWTTPFYGADPPGNPSAWTYCNQSPLAPTFPAVGQSVGICNVWLPVVLQSRSHSCGGGPLSWLLGVVHLCYIIEALIGCLERASPKNCVRFSATFRWFIFFCIVSELGNRVRFVFLQTALVCSMGCHWFYNRIQLNGAELQYQI